MTTDNQPTAAPRVTADPGVQPEQEPAVAATFADEVATLRAQLAESWTWPQIRLRDEALATLDRIVVKAEQRAAEDAVVRAARRWYYEHGYTPGYLPRNIVGSDRDLKAAVESLGGAA